MTLSNISKNINDILFNYTFLHYLHNFSSIIETEIILGLPSQLSEGASADRGGVEREMKAIWCKIQKSFRSLFYEDMPVNVEGKGQGQNGEEGERAEGQGEGVGDGEGSAWIFNRASAWYAVAYGIKSDSKLQTVHATTPRGGRYLGFGWIMGDILCQIPARLAYPPALYGDANDTTTEAPSFLLYFGHHLRAHWNMQSKELFETMKIKMSAFKNLDDALGPGSALLFGSVAQYLCDAYSDIDICVPVPMHVTAPMTVTAAMTVPVTAPVPVTVQGTSGIEGMRTLSFSDNALEGIPRMARLSLKGIKEDEGAVGSGGEGEGEGGSGEREGEGWTRTREEGEVEEVGCKGGGSGEWLDMPIPDFTLSPLSPSISNPLHSPLRSPLHTPLQSPLHSPFSSFALSPLVTSASPPLHIPLSSPVLSPALTRELKHLNSTVAPVVEPLTTAMTYAVSASDVPILRYVRLTIAYKLLSAQFIVYIQLNCETLSTELLLI
jgi:hypothetical protein